MRSLWRKEKAQGCQREFFTLPETNIAYKPPKMDGWNTTFLLERPIFRGYVSFREGNQLAILPLYMKLKMHIEEMKQPVLYYLVVEPTHLKNMFVKSEIFPNN